MDRDPDKYFLGIFYFDKDDPRILLPKVNRTMGYTVNFARPEAYLILIIIIVVAFITSELNK